MFGFVQDIHSKILSIERRHCVALDFVKIDICRLFNSLARNETTLALQKKKAKKKLLDAYKIVSP